VRSGFTRSEPADDLDGFRFDAFQVERGTTTPRTRQNPQSSHPRRGDDWNGTTRGEPENNGAADHTHGRETAFLAAVDEAVADGTLRWITDEERDLLKRDEP
jgi:hypothetical protein